MCMRILPAKLLRFLATATGWRSSSPEAGARASDRGRGDRRLRDGRGGEPGRAGLPVVVVNPAQVRHWQALGKRAKTDPIDAAVIARFVEATRPAVRVLPDEATQLLADLVARRAPDRRDDGGRRPARTARRQAPEEEASPDCARRSRRNWPNSTPGSTTTCAARRSGPKRWICSPAPALAGDRPHADRRNAGTGNARPPSDRRAPPASRANRQSGQWKGELHRRRPQERAQPAVPRRADRGAAQSGPQGLPATARSPPASQDGRRHRRRTKAADDPQRHPAGQKAMARRNRLTPNTVAEERLKGASRRAVTTAFPTAILRDARFAGSSRRGVREPTSLTRRSNPGERRPKRPFRS